ncbi:MAG: hypothetical protein RL021_2182 [Bacteroidota bacterium]|jgi:hypothetical protein
MIRYLRSLLPFMLSLTGFFVFAQPANVANIAKLTGDTLMAARSDTAWHAGGFVNLNFSQVSLSNWAPGGESSYSVNGSFNGFANYDKGRIRWDNSLLLSYALQKTASNGVRKTDDQIDFTSKFGYRLKKHVKWYYSALLNFKSQFANGYDYPEKPVISKFMSPAYVTSSVGITWRPTDYFEVLFSPVTSKITFVLDDSIVGSNGRYGVEPGNNSRSEVGAYLNARFRKEIMTNVTLASRLELFDNYTDKVISNRDNVDVNWETGFLMKVNKLITASIVFQVVYDDNVLSDTQFRQVLGVGLGYKFANR